MSASEEKVVSFSCSERHLRRSNALRIKSNNLELLPYPLKESLMALKQSRFGGSNGAVEEEELSLLDQIKRGVRLRPARSRRKKRTERGGTDRSGCAHGEEGEEGDSPCSRGDDDDKSTISAILFRVLRERYLAVQQTDDDDSELSSIESGSGHGPPTNEVDDLFLVGYKGRGANYCVLYGPSESQKRGLLERFAEIELTNNIEVARGLINDLTVRL